MSVNVDALRAMYARWEQGDLAASVGLLDENVTLLVDADIPDGGSYQGTDGVRDYMARFLEPWDSLTMAGGSYRDAGDSVLVKVHQTGIGRSAACRSSSTTSTCGRSRGPGGPARGDHGRRAGASGVDQAGDALGVARRQLARLLEERRDHRQLLRREPARDAPLPILGDRPPDLAGAVVEPGRDLHDHLPAVALVGHPPRVAGPARGGRSPPSPRRW